MGFLDFVKEEFQKIADVTSTPVHHSDETKFCFPCMKLQTHKWVEQAGFFSPPKWKCTVCGTTKKASLFDVVK